MKMKKMDILYLTANTIDKMANYCEKELTAKVIGHFANCGKVITENDENRTFVATGISLLF